MAKLIKSAEQITRLRELVMAKTAEAQDKVTGKPGELKAESLPNLEIDKNKTKATELAQKHEQKPAEGDAVPTKSANEKLTDLANEILLEAKKAEAQDSVTGKPGELKAESLPNLEIDKNKTKATELEQKHEQKPAEGDAVPTKKASEIEEMRKKIAAHDLGCLVAASLVGNTKQASVKEETALLKEAARRDVEMLVSQAQEELKNNSYKLAEVELAKQAEALGALTFDIYTRDEYIKKQAAYIEELKGAVEKVAAENSALTADLTKAASYFQQNDEQVKLAHLIESVSQGVIAKLKSETSDK